MSESWRPVVDPVGHYEVSNLGQLRRGERVLRLTPNLQGYLGATLWVQGKSHQKMIAHLVAAAFIGPRPKGLQVAHLNGNPKDNRAVNLEYVTVKENSAHKKRHGTEPTGERTHNHLLSEADIPEIRRRRAAGETLISIGRHFGVRLSTIWSVVSGRTWSHVDEKVT